VPPEFIAKLVARRQQIGQLEIAAGVTPYLSLPDDALERLKGRDVIHWIDNTSAQAALVKGYARAVDSAKMVHVFHAVNMHLRCNAYFAYVPSAANVADLPSRGDTQFLVERLGSELVASRFPSVDDWLGGAEQWLTGAGLTRPKPDAPVVVVANAHNPSKAHRSYATMVALRPHPLSNPFAMRGERQRDAAVDAFASACEHPEVPLRTIAADFGVTLVAKPASAERREEGLAAATAEAARGPLALVCACTPRRCHCDVVRDIVLRRLSVQGGAVPAPARQRARRRKRSRSGGQLPEQ
jgi:hypothetical protein